MQSVPHFLQPILWSVDIKHLHLQKDKVYIIHQILSHGTMPDIVWLFKTYSKKEIRAIFLTHSYKNYRAARFAFVKNFLLNLRQTQLDERHYVENIPRDLG